MLKRLKLDTKLLREMDFSILIATILIVLFGIVNIYAAMKPDASDAKKQLLWFGVSLVVLYFILLVDYNILRGFAPILYWGSIVLLIYTRFMGATINGARGWIKVGSLFSIQASELAKVAIIFMLAKKLDEMELKVNNLKNFMILAAYTLLPVALIVIQPDMGMTMVCFFIVLGIFFCAGLDMKIILGGLTSLVFGIIVLWNSGLIEPYQKKKTYFLLKSRSGRAWVWPSINAVNDWYRVRRFFWNWF